MRQTRVMCFLVIVVCLCAAGTAVAQDGSEKIRKWIADLSVTESQQRNKATQALIAAGQPAVAAVSRLVGSPDAEVDSRAKKILTTFFDADDDGTYQAALESLRELSRSDNADAAGFASKLLGRQQRLVPWLHMMGAKFTVDPATSEQPIVELRLDRTRGIDPGFTPDGLQDADFVRLKPLRDLRFLTLEYRTTMSDAALRHLASLKSLESLNLSRTRITGAGLGHLSGLKHLQTLDLSLCPNIKDFGLVELKQLTQLRELNLDANCSRWCSDDLWLSQLRYQLPPGHDSLAEYRGGITDAGLKHIGELRELSALSLERTQITNSGLASIANLQDLEILDLSRTQIDDQGVAQLAAHSKLKILNLNFAPTAGASLANLKGLQDLEVLRLRGTAVTDDTLKALVGLENLHTLDLSATRITDASVDLLAQIPNLKSLDVSRSRVSIGGLLRLADVCEQFDLKAALVAGRLATLDVRGEVVTLQLGQNFICDEHLKHLKPFRQLQSLALSSSSITDEGLVHLNGLTRLRSLALGNTAITDEGLKHLKGLTSLEYLGVRGSQVTFGGVVRLFTDLQGRSLTDAIHIARYHGYETEYPVWSGDFLPDAAGLQDAAPAGLTRAKSPKGLTLIDVSRAGVTDADVAAISKLESLGALMVQNNPITDAALGHLSHCEQLELLWCGGAAITGDGLGKLATLPNLHTLWLTDTKIVDRDLSTLKTLPKLRVLNLCGAPISDAASHHLQQCQSLQYLVVDGTAFSTEVLEQLQKARPALQVFLSQKRPLAAIRGRERTQKTMPEGYHRGLEMAPVQTTIPKVSLAYIFGDEHFEIAQELRVDNRVVADSKYWSQLPTLKKVNFTATASAEQIATLKLLPELRSVGLYRGTVDDDSLSHLTQTSLEELDLQRSTVTDAGLKHVGQIRTLKSLSLGGYGTEITDKGVAFLSALENLETLGLSRTNITDTVLTQLLSLQNLKTLELREVRVGEGVKHIGKLSNLASLDLSYTFVSDETLPHLYGLKKLRRLSLPSTFVTQEGTDLLKKHLPEVAISTGALLPSEMIDVVEPFRKARIRMSWNDLGQVTTLDLRRVPDINSLWRHVLKLPDLTQLRIGGQATEQHLTDVVRLANLADLDLQKSTLTDAELLQLSKLPSLTVLRLRYMNVSGSGFAQWPQASKLQSLDLKGTQVDDEGARHIGNLKNLTFVNLADTKLSDQGLERLANLENIEILVLDGTTVSDDGVSHFKRMRKLREVHLRQTNITETGVKAILEMLPETTLHTDLRKP